MAGRKLLYNADTFPLLVEGYAREGLNDKQICKNIGIGKSAYYECLNKYSEFSDALKRGRKPVDIEVENALLKRALGYDYDEKMSEVELDASGQPRPTKVKTTKKHVPGDVGAMAFWLKNRKKSEWKDRHSHEVGGEDGNPIPIETTTKFDIDYTKLPTEALEAIVNARVQPDTNS